MSPSPRESRVALRAAAKVAADDHDGVLSRGELRSLGYASHDIAREVRAGRWQLHGRQTVALHTGDLSRGAQRWRAVWEVGAGIAVLDGVSALEAAGLTGFNEPSIHVSVRHTHDIVGVDGVTIHKVASRTSGDVLTNGVPRARPEVAAIRGAHWAVSDRQAALVLAMATQQRLIDGPRLRDTRRRVRGRNRRALITQLIRDVTDGAQSLGELDFLALCTRHGVPRPVLQTVRLLPNGRAYLDARWPQARLGVEIDGSGHRVGLAVSADNLRQNDLALTHDDLILRIDLVGMRVHEAEFMDQVRRGYLARSPIDSRYSAAQIS